MKGSGSWHRWQKDIKTDILTELLFIDNDRIYMGGAIYGMIIVTFKGSGAAVQKACGRSRALKRVQEGHTEPTEQRVQNQACLSYAETRWRKMNVKAQKTQKLFIRTQISQISQIY